MDYVTSTGRFAVDREFVYIFAFCLEKRASLLVEGQVGGRVRVRWVGAGCASVQVSVATWQDSPPWMIFKFCSTSAAKWPVGLRKVNGLQRERHFFSPLFHPPLMTFNFCSTSLLKRQLLFPKFTGLQRERHFFW